MSNTNKKNIIYTYKKSPKSIFFGNLSPKMSDPAFQINNTLKQYVDRKLNENIIELEKPIFKAKNNIIKLKSFQDIPKRNNRQNDYTTTNSISKDNLQIFSSLQNLSISIINSNNKNININGDNILYKNMTSKKRDNPHKIFSYTKINDKRIKINNEEYRNKSSNKIKFNLSGKIPRIKTKNIFKKYINSSSSKNIKIDNYEKNINKTNIKEKDHFNTLFRFNSSDMKNIETNNNLYSERCISIKDNLDNNHFSLTQRLNSNPIKFNNKNKTNKITTSFKNKKKFVKKNKNKNFTKNHSKFQTKKNNKNQIKKKEIKMLNKNKKDNYYSGLNNIKIDNINNDNNNNNNKNINREGNNYYIPSIGKTESNNNSILNLHLNDQRFMDGYELCWNLKNDYSKDIDISFISINNQKKSIKNYKLNSNNINDNNNINNIYLNNIQNVNNINNKENCLNNIYNKEEYYNKLELLENENKLLKNEIKESKNRISALEYKIEELLDDKNSKEKKDCPQPTPYVVKYSKDIFPPKTKPKIEENSQEQFLKTSNEILKEYSKNETKESDMSNRIVTKNEEELNFKKSNL